MAIHSTAVVDPGAHLDPTAVDIGPFAVIEAGVHLAAGVSVGAHAVLTGDTHIGEDTRIFHHAVVGEAPQDKKYAGEPTRLEIGARNVIREFVTINRGTAVGGGLTRLGDDNFLMAYAHVAHDCTLGNGCILANSVALAGHVEVQDNAIIGGLVGVHQHGRIGRCAMLGGGAMAAQDVPPFTIAQGDRARLFGLNIVGLRRNGFSAATTAALKGAYRELFAQGTPLRIAMEQVREQYGEVPEVLELVSFIQGSTRGICRSVGSEPNFEG